MKKGSGIGEAGTRNRWGPTGALAKGMPRKATEGDSSRRRPRTMPCSVSTCTHSHLPSLLLPAPADEGQTRGKSVPPLRSPLDPRAAQRRRRRRAALFIINKGGGLGK